MFMTTFTNTNACLAPNYDLEGVLHTLKDDGLLLLPTDTLWSVGCDATNQVALKRLTRLVQTPYAGAVEILVDSVTMLKKYVLELHPRIETLLCHHVRPLTILMEGTGQPQGVKRRGGDPSRRRASARFPR